MDFGSMAKTLGKYGTGVSDTKPKTARRSAIHTNYTMTGHKETIGADGRRTYTKVLPDDEDSNKAAKAEVKAEMPEQPKRGRGRPKGAVNKEKSYKPWSAEAKASLKAKLAARRAAKAQANESLASSDWEDLLSEMTLDNIVEFMLEEDYSSLDEASKDSLIAMLQYEESEDAEQTVSESEDPKDPKETTKIDESKTEVPVKTQAELNMERYVAAAKKSILLQQ